MEYINFIINCALHDCEVKLKDYQYLKTVALSLGFNFMEDFVLL